MLSPARPWPRARRCAKSNCKIASCSAWNFPPLHAFGNEIDVNYGRAWTPGRRNLEGLCFLARTRREWVGEIGLGMDVFLLQASASGGSAAGVIDGLGGDRTVRCMAESPREQPLGRLAL